METRTMILWWITKALARCLWELLIFVPVIVAWFITVWLFGSHLIDLEARADNFELFIVKWLHEGMVKDYITKEDYKKCLENFK